MNPRLRAALIAAALATITFQLVTFYVNGWPGPPAPLFVVSTTVVLAAYLGTGIIAWQRHPADKIGLLFTLTGYAWFLPQLLSLHYALAFTIANGTAFVYQGCLGHLGLAWPYGKLRGRADRDRGRRQLRLEHRQPHRRQPVLEPQGHRLQRGLPGQPPAHRRLAPPLPGRRPDQLAARRPGHGRGDRAHRRALAALPRLRQTGDERADLGQHPGGRRHHHPEPRRRHRPQPVQRADLRGLPAAAGRPAGGLPGRRHDGPAGARRGQLRARQHGTGPAPGQAQGRAGPGARRPGAPAGRPDRRRGRLHRTPTVPRWTWPACPPGGWSPRWTRPARPSSSTTPSSGTSRS